jgi:hypothetical protein
MYLQLHVMAKIILNLGSLDVGSGLVVATLDRLGNSFIVLKVDVKEVVIGSNDALI